MILFAGTNLPNRAMREQITSAVDLIVQVARLADGAAAVMSITEVTAMEGDVISTQEIYRFRRRGVSPEGQVIGTFEPTGVRPQFMDRLGSRASNWRPPCSRCGNGGVTGMNSDDRPAPDPGPGVRRHYDAARRRVRVREPRRLSDEQRVRARLYGTNIEARRSRRASSATNG
jgi:hypothetical protein